MTRLAFIFFLWLMCSGLNAQDRTFTITGIVLDSATNSSVELATVAMKIKGDENILNAGSADADGKFELTNIKAGKYQLLIAFMGYNTKTIPIEVNADINLGKLYISSSVNTLKEAVVVAARAEMTVTADKTVFNVAQSPNNQIGNADDLLRNIPGVTVDQDGNVSVTGKQGVKVLVDGKPNAMADNDLPGFLKSLPANSVESIEVINNPSARYDAEGNAGIINIKLKKGKGDGFNVALSAGYGILNRYNGNFNINYKKNKYNLFLNYGVNGSRTGFNSVSNRTLTLKDTTSYYNYMGTGVQKRFSNNLKAGFDYFFNDKNTLTCTASGNYSNNHHVTNAIATNLNNGDLPTGTFISVNQNSGYNYNISNNISYTKKFDSTDRQLDINMNYSYVGSDNDVRLNSLAYDSSRNYLPGSSLQQQTYSPNSIQNVMVKVDYTHPLKRLPNNKIEAGFKSETTINKNFFNDYGTVNNISQFDTLLSNQLKYVENVAAAYGILSGNYKGRFSYSGGLRIEQTYISSQYSAINKDYIDFFPSASTGYQFNDTQNISLSYSRRIQRPPFRYINNTITYTDQFTIWQGNPLLQPSFSNNISIAYSHAVLKHQFVLKAGGTFINDGFTGIAAVDSNRVTRSTQVNGANSKAFNTSLYMKLHFTNWCEMQAYYNFSYTYYGFAPGINLTTIQGTGNNLWGSLRFKFWENAALELNGWFNTRSITPQGANLPVGSFNASLKKTFLKDHLTVSLAANDIANTMKWRWTTANQGLQTYGSWQSTNRYLMITVSYRFGSHDLEERKQREENERIDNKS